MSKKIMPKTALLSVSDKSGIVSFGKFLKKHSNLSDSRYLIDILNLNAYLI